MLIKTRMKWHVVKADTISKTATCINGFFVWNIIKTRMNWLEVKADCIVQNFDTFSNTKEIT